MAVRILGTDSAAPGLPSSVVATTAEVLAGTDNTQGVTPAGLQARVSADKSTPLHDTYTGKATGALGLADTGQTWARYHSPVADTAAALTIVGGKLTSTTVTAVANTAGYIDTDLGARATRMGGRFTFDTAGTTDTATVGILAWSAAHNPATPSVHPPAHIHLAINPQWATYAIIWDNAGVNTFEVLHTHYFSARLATDGTTVHETEVIVDGNTAWCRLPDGAIIPVTDSRIGPIVGRFAGFEVFYTNPSTDHRPGFTDVWADALPSKPYNVVPLASILKLSGDSANGWELFAEYTTPGTTSPGPFLPSNITEAEVIVVAGSGGGGSGRRGAAGTVRCGGGGGGGGSIMRQTFRGASISSVGANFAVTVGAAGVGGAAVTVDDTNGNAGTAGTFSSASCGGLGFLALAGGGGFGGTSSTGSAGVGQLGYDGPASHGGAASVTGGVAVSAATTASTASGGGAGGGVTTGNVAAAGGGSGKIGWKNTAALGGAVDTVGGTGYAPTQVEKEAGFGGGGGGGGGASTTVAGGPGGPAGLGGGGGGGGASVNGQASGVGGAGTAGYVAIWIRRK